MKENPLIRRSEKLATLLQRYLGEFGLTPMTQSKVQGDKREAVDPTEVFLRSLR